MSVVLALNLNTFFGRRFPPPHELAPNPQPDSSPWGIDVGAQEKIESSTTAKGDISAVNASVTCRHTEPTLSAER